MSIMTIDQVGFTFNELHSVRDLGLYRVSSSNRYDETMGASQKDTTVDIAGADGLAYVNTKLTSRTWSLNLAYNAMTDVQMRKLKQLWTGKVVAELVFDEMPYKAWDAKLNSAPTFKYISFIENGARIYKGEATLQFIAYYPYAHTPSKVWNGSDGTLAAADGRLSGVYGSYYTNKSYWLASSQLDTVYYRGSLYYNCGDIAAPIKFTVPLSGTYDSVKITVGSDVLVISVDSTVEYTSLTLDTKIGVAIAHTATTSVPVRVSSGNPLVKLPVSTAGTTISIKRCNGSTETDVTSSSTIDYEYWYY